MISLDKTTAIVVTYNSERTLERCLRQLDLARLQRILLIDNASTDGTLEVAERLSSELDTVMAVIKNTGNVGFGRAVNQAAVRAPSASALLLVNPDCFASPDCVHSLVRTMAEHPTCAVIAPSMRLPNGERGVSGGAMPSVVKELIGWMRIDEVLPRWLVAKVLVLAKRAFPDSVIGGYGRAVCGVGYEEFDWVSGFCMLTDAAVWRALEGFDERYFMYFEDVDYCLRVQQTGRQSAVLHDVAAEHVESASSTKSTKSRLYYQSFEKFSDRWLGHMSTTISRVMARVAR